NIGAQSAFRLNVTGTTAITSLGTTANSRKLLRFSDALTLTHNATTLILPGAANITTAAGDFALAVSDASGNWTIAEYSKADGTPIVNGASGGLAAKDTLSGYLSGLLVSNNGTDADHDIDIAAGECASNDSTPQLIALSSAFTKQADATFAEGTGNGGMVSGESLPASGTVHVWAISKADGTADVCFNNHATSGLSPTLPSGFSYKRRIGSLRTDSSNNIRGFIAFGGSGGRWFWLKSPPLDVNASVGSTHTTYSITVPSGFRVLAWVSHNNGDGRSAYVRSPEVDDLGASTVAAPLYTQSDPNAGRGGTVILVPTNTSGQIRAVLSSTGTIRIATYGWLDFLEG
ncbi:MAG: hypothetical protein MK041_13160, partial [Aquabacterium sp.]|nr:hypothetical protein [Aquabacterium sp.]